MPSNSKSVQTLSIIRVSKISEIRFLKINNNKLETNDDDIHKNEQTQCEGDNDI